MLRQISLVFRLTGVVGAIAIAIAAASSTARASVIVTQSAAPAPSYVTTLNFDEAGGPTGANVPNNSWAASHNIPIFQSGEGSNFVGDNTASTGQGTNSYYGPFGVFINFGTDLTAMSFQGWDNGGPASPFGGGAVAVAFDNGNEVGAAFVTPAWGGFGSSWYNITTTGGSVFDEVRFLGFAFFPQSVVDNLSWNAVPEPASLTLLAMAGIGALIRRRR